MATVFTTICVRAVGLPYPVVVIGNAVLFGLIPVIGILIRLQPASLLPGAGQNGPAFPAS